MTAKSAARITGLEIRPLPREGRRFRYEAMSEAGFVAEAGGNEPKSAVRSLVEKLYDMQRATVFREQGYRCFMCYRVVPLECHHLTPRSHGRSDRRENLIGLDQGCHELVERGRAREKPHAAMLERLGSIGWKWVPGEYASANGKSSVIRYPRLERI